MNLMDLPLPQGAKAVDGNSAGEVAGAFHGQFAALVALIGKQAEALNQNITDGLNAIDEVHSDIERDSQDMIDAARRLMAQVGGVAATGTSAAASAADASGSASTSGQAGQAGQAGQQGVSGSQGGVGSRPVGGFE